MIGVCYCVFLFIQEVSMIKLVFGVGVNDRKYSTFANGKKTKEYVLWKSMLQRYYSDSFKKKRPTYEGCEVS